MRRTAIAVMAVAVAVYAAGLSAQTKPNFAGTWVMQTDPNAAPPAGGGRMGRMGGGGGWGQEFTIVQSGTDIKVTRTMGDTQATETYLLTGEGKNSMTMGRGGNAMPMDVTYKSSWVGNNFQIVTTQSMGGNSVEITRTLSLAPDGTLTIETARPGQGGTPQTSKVTYKKKS
jgi:hypothetical protein